MEDRARVAIITRGGKSYLRISVGGKSKAIKRAESRQRRRAVEIQSHLGRSKKKESESRKEAET